MSESIRIRSSSSETGTARSDVTRLSLEAAAAPPAVTGPAAEKHDYSPAAPVRGAPNAAAAESGVAGGERADADDEPSSSDDDDERVQLYPHDLRDRESTLRARPYVPDRFRFQSGSDEYSFCSNTGSMNIGKKNIMSR